MNGLVEENPLAIEKNKRIINIPPDTDFNGTSATLISEREFAFDIWLIMFDKKFSDYTISLYRYGIICKLESKGFYKRYRGNNSYILIREIDNIICEVEQSILKDDMFSEVKAISKTIEVDCNGHSAPLSAENLRETFLKQSHLIFNDNFLEHLKTHSKPILRDTKDISYYFFTNTIVVVKKSCFEFLEYNMINNQCIWDTQIIDHELKYNSENKDCHFSKFISNVSNNECDRLNAFISSIGYLLHNYSDPSRGQAVIAYDEEITNLKNPMGGTGKGLLANGIKQMRNVAKIDGKKFDPNDRFKYQDISESTQVVWLDDVKPDLGFETFHSVLTDGWSIEKKYKAQFFIKPEDSPKMLICSNAILNGNGTTNKRRQLIIEFSNHYSKQIKFGNEEPIKKEHGCLFFDNNDWDLQEWNMFFSFMLDCVRNYLLNGIQNYQYKGLNKNKLIQSTNEDFCNWVEEQNFEAKTHYDTAIKFEDFRDTYYSSESDFKQRGFTNWLKIFAESKDWKFIAKTNNGKQIFSFSS